MRLIVPPTLALEIMDCFFHLAHREDGREADDEDHFSLARLVRKTSSAGFGTSRPL